MPSDRIGRTGEREFDAQAAAHRDQRAGPLFAEAYRARAMGPGSDPDLIAGSREDPVLVAGVGYPLLGDLAVGTVVAYRVAALEVPGMAVADCSHTPVAAFQTITDGAYQTVVVVGAEKRGGELNDGTPSETPGAVHEYRAGEFPVSEADLARRVGESVMGSNTVENVVAVGRAFGGLPADTWVITVEPGYDSWGLNVDEFTGPVAAVLPEVVDRVMARVAGELG